MLSFNEIFVDSTKYCTKIKTDEYHETGKNIIVDQGQNEIAGYTDLEDGLFSDVPAIIFGDHTRIIKYVDKPFFIGADGVKVLKSKYEKTNYKYLYYALKNVKIPNTGYNRHFKWLKEAKINYPEISIQKDIVSTLDLLQSIITHRRTQLEKLDLLVKARFVEMFGDCVSNNMNWDSKPMSEVAPSKPYKELLEGNAWLLNLDMIEAQTGRIIDYLYVDKSEVGNSTSAFDEGNVLYSKLRPYLNKVVVPKQKGYATTELVPLRPNDLLNREFLAYLLRSDNFVSYINEKVAGAKMPRVSMDVFREFKCILPPLELQTQFADFVKQVDKSKVAVQKELDKAKMLFDSLMQEYFG